MKRPPDLLGGSYGGDLKVAGARNLSGVADEVAADCRWADQAIGDVKDHMRQEIYAVRIPALWPMRQLRDNMIRNINLIKTKALLTIERVRDFREHLIRETRMLPVSTKVAGRPLNPTGLKELPSGTLNSVLAQTEMELRVRRNIARSRSIPGLLD